MPDEKLVFVYDPEKVNVLVNGTSLTGYAPAGKVTLAYNEDIVTTQTGVSGDHVYNENANTSALATITLLGTSPSLKFLRDLCVRRQMVNFAVVDANNDDTFHASEERCRVMKVPDLARLKESSDATITIFIPELTIR